MPTAERLLPYLQRIDSSRIYTNWGPLSTELELRLARQLGLPEGAVSSAGSGTAALVGAILASAGRASGPRDRALLPAFTFVATAAAVEHCGYGPYLGDVDAHTWMLEPDRLVDHPALERIGLVVPVAPFGRPVPQASWQRFAEVTGIPVVIDGGACFDRVGEDPDNFLGKIPVAMSFHATKFFSTGEGGGVASTDAALIARAGRALNFGFHSARDSRSPSLNGKMSEYHAAVGLAELDDWDTRRRAFEDVAQRYLNQLSGAGLADRLIVSPEIGASYALFRCNDAPEGDRVSSSLERAGVEYRLWYGRGLHSHAYFADLPREELATTERLAPCLLGVPLASDLDDGELERVVEALAGGVGEPA